MYLFQEGRKVDLAESRCVLVGPFPGWELLRKQTESQGWTVTAVESGAEAFRALEPDGGPFVVVLPPEMRDGPAENLLRRVRRGDVVADLLVASGNLSREERSRLLAEGAEEVFEEPLDLDRITRKMAVLRDRRRLIDDLGLVVRDAGMLELFERLLRVAPLKVTMLITGESGTGKEMLAQAIHRASDRRDAPFVAVNVGALPENLLESELFGHEKGAFTSADSRRIGRFEMANGGTLFLDEIGEMPLPAQVNLLRVLEEERFLRVGGSTPVSVDVRVVAATHRDLEEMVRQGSFRRDLYYRLHVVHLEVPPLRARPDEIPLLARAFARGAATRHGLTFPGFARETLEALRRYDWPGNVRELRNLVDGIVAMRPEDPVAPDDLPGHVLHGRAAERGSLLPALPRDRSEAEREFVIQSLLALRSEVATIRELLMGRLPGAAPDWRSGGATRGAVYPTGPVRVEESDVAGSHSLQDLEQRAVERALADAGGNRRLAAEMLGISERTLYRRIKQFALDD
ncbi:sigma-54 dependent transcriptional regulator [bacterium]|nr:sigma-54 dependent transcriptional regulator [bacterium]